MPFDMEQAFGELKADFDKMSAKIKNDAQSALDEQKRLGTLTDETKAAADKVLNEQGEMKARLDDLATQARDMEQKLASRRPGSAEKPKSMGQLAMESDAMKALAAMTTKSVSGDISLGIFNAITALPGSAGDLQIEQVETEIQSEPQRKLRVREVINVSSTSQALIKYFKEVSRTGAAGFVPDDGITVKPLIDKTFEAASAEVVTIAGRMEIHKHMLDDLPALRSDIDSTLRYEVMKAEDAAILAGDGVDPNPLGLIQQATAYAMTARENADTTILDRLRLAMLQVAAAGYVTDAHILNIFDWGDAELLKDANKRYIFGDPGAGTATPRLWGRPVVDTEIMPEGDFLSGEFKRAATWYDRQQIEILLSSENRDNFDKNMLTVRGEKRGALAVKRPLAMVYFNGA